MISIIAAISRNYVIGAKNALPWYLPEDLRRFKALTTGKTVLMGRLTYDSIVARIGGPLPNRLNIVANRNPEFVPEPGVLVTNDLLTTLKENGEEELFVIGGGQIFEIALPFADKLYITWVEKEIEGDVYFPKFNESDYTKTFEEKHDGFTFVNYEKK